MRDLYISVDIEASGPIPGDYSMLSFGACVVGEPAKTFYAELKPLNDRFVKQALEVCGLSMEKLAREGRDPKNALAAFRDWIKSVTPPTHRPLFVGFNAPFDWMFLQWYFLHFLGEAPFGFSGLDIKAYYMGMKGCVWSETSKHAMDPRFKSDRPHTHNALDDALEQAEIFQKMIESRSDGWAGQA